MTDMGLLHFFLGLEIWQDQRGIFISQRRYVQELLQAFDMQECKPISTPMDPNQKLSAHDDAELTVASLYRKLVGSLIWLLDTRLDMLLAGFMSEPKKTHWQAGLCVLQYLKANPDCGIWYAAGTTEEEVFLRGWTDSDWAGDIDHKRSTTGYCFTLGSGAISWSSKKQPTVALSSTEAEYRVACTATCEVVWLRRLLEELGFPQRKGS